MQCCLLQACRQTLDCLSWGGTVNSRSCLCANHKSRIAQITKPHCANHNRIAQITSRIAQSFTLCCTCWAAAYVHPSALHNRSCTLLHTLRRAQVLFLLGHCARYSGAWHFSLPGSLPKFRCACTRGSMDGDRGDIAALAGICLLA